MYNNNTFKKANFFLKYESLPPFLSFGIFLSRFQTNANMMDIKAIATTTSNVNQIINDFRLSNSCSTSAKGAEMNLHFIIKYSKTAYNTILKYNVHYKCKIVNRQLLTLDVTILDVMLHVIMYVICVSKFKNDKLIHSLMNKSYFDFIRTTANRCLYSRLFIQNKVFHFTRLIPLPRDRQACCNDIETI